MALTFYCNNLSQPVRAVDMFLRANKMEHTRKELDFFKGDHKTQEFLEVNPFGALPAISHGDFHLSDSMAIMKYLHTEFNLPDHWYPADPKKRAKLDVYIGWHGQGIRQHGSILFLSVALEKFGLPPYGKPEKVADAKVDFEHGLDKAEAIFLKETPFLNSDSVSIADLMFVNEIFQPMLVNYDMKGKHPKIFEYILRVRQTLGEQLFDDVVKQCFVKMEVDYIV